ncbi:mitochondrial membrane protein Pet127 [Histoplasma ohiense]|nr:mitochondrial membrane protein Pet127 [Histoplasma ohiense (nom. inval.)]
MLRRSLKSSTRPMSGFICLSCLVAEVGLRAHALPSFRRSLTTTHVSSEPTNPSVIVNIKYPPPTQGSGTISATPGSGKKPKKKAHKPKKAGKVDNVKEQQANANPSPGKHLDSKAAAKPRKKRGVHAPAKLQSRTSPSRPRKDRPSLHHSRQDNAIFHSAKNVQHPRHTRQQMENVTPPRSPRKKREKHPQATGGTQSGILESTSLSLTPLSIEGAPVPRLSYGLERALFNPGVYHLQDPRTRVYNFDPYLGSIMPVKEFDFSALNEYITSSRDDGLRKLAVCHGKKYIGSSSSMTSVLSHFHYLLSAWRPLNTSSLSQGFSDVAKNFTKILRAPSAVFLRYKDGVYAIDADKEYDNANILMNLGRSMEKLLTMPTEEFERYRRSSADKVKPDTVSPETYHYTTCGNFLMRAQLDAYDPRLPGTGMFDLKTRAVVSIRMNTKHYDRGLGYQIKGRFGKWESFEREYFDMIRAAFLKYSLQVRVGRMDGIFVAFHNIERIFGFQYVSLPEMDLALHGQTDTALGDAEFQLSVSLWDKVLAKATEKFPNQSLRFHFETRETQIPCMYVFAEPVTEEQIEEIQNRNKAEIENVQKKLLFPDELEQEGENALEKEGTSLQASSSETSAEAGASASGIADDAPEREISGDEAAADFHTGDPVDPCTKPIFAMAITIQSKVNGKPVERPTFFSSKDKWDIEYTFTMFNKPDRAWAIYSACQRRRELSLALDDDETIEDNAYQIQLQRISQEGRAWRKRQDKMEEETGTIVLQ